MNEQLRDLFSDALETVRAAQLPTHLEVAAFEKAIDLLSGYVRNQAALTTAPLQPTLAGTPLQSTSSLSHQSPIQRIAEKLTLELSIVEEVYSVTGDGQLEIIVGSGKLSEKKGPATREIALLVAGGRQLGGLEEWTATQSIRDVCQMYGRFDTSNFADYIKEMDRHFGFRGKGTAREVKINRAGWDNLRNLITALTELRK